MHETFDEHTVVEFDVILCLDAELRVTYWDAAADWFGRANDAPELCRPAPLGRSVLDYMTEPDRAYYARAFRHVLAQAQPWEHRDECSSSDLYRLCRVLVLPLMKHSGLLVISSLQVEHAHDRVPCVSAEERYRNGQRLI